MFSLRKLRIGGYDKVILLSQYIGDFQPEAHVNGVFGSNFIAFICKSNLAVAFAVSLFKIMLQMYKVFMNDKPIFVIDSVQIQNNFEVFDFKEFNLQKVISVLEKSTVNGVVLVSNNLQKDWDCFLKEFKVIEAAGGKVQNQSKEILFIYRFDKWDLPKGHIEKGEVKEEAAIREVIEECGISGLEILNPLETTYHGFYNRKKKLCLKVTYWFLMKTDYDGVLTPQLEEGITQVQFKNKSESNEALKNTYENIKLLF
jgi:ADP-ribose pyrophosphatase YjhB (NUDIX family)